MYIITNYSYSFKLIVNLISLSFLMIHNDAMPSCIIKWIAQFMSNFNKYAFKSPMPVLNKCLSVGKSSD